MPPQGNSPSLENLMKQLATSSLEFQQTMSSNNMQFQQNMNATIQDLKTQIVERNYLDQHRNSCRDLLMPTPSRILAHKTVPLSFPTRTISTRKPESDEELLKMFHKVEINIPLLEAIKQIPKYAKFLKELCVHKRKKMKGSVEVGGIVSALTKNEEFTTGAQVLPRKCRDP
ncbi:hypothetical protein CR513_15174, partial [Mucuna pruriens]